MIFGTGRFGGAPTKLDPGEWASGAPGASIIVVGGVAGAASCDVEVTVRYKAAVRYPAVGTAVGVRYRAVLESITGFTQAPPPPQDHISKSGNSGSSTSAAASLSVSKTATYVQPLGSWLRSSPVWTPTEIGGCDGNVNTPLLLLSPDAEYPEMAHVSDWMVIEVDVPLMTVGSVPQRA